MAWGYVGYSGRHDCCEFTRIEYSHIGSIAMNKRETLELDFSSLVFGGVVVILKM